MGLCSRPSPLLRRCQECPERPPGKPPRRRSHRRGRPGQNPGRLTQQHRSPRARWGREQRATALGRCGGAAAPGAGRCEDEPPRGTRRGWTTLGAAAADHLPAEAVGRGPRPGRAVGRWTGGAVGRGRGGPRRASTHAAIPTTSPSPATGLAQTAASTASPTRTSASGAGPPNQQLPRTRSRKTAGVVGTLKRRRP